MKQYKVPQLFQELADRDPAEVCRRSQCQWDESTKAYTITLWDDEYQVFPLSGRIERITANNAEPHEYFAVFVLNYLLHVKEVPLRLQWISVSDIPGGATFFRGPHEIPTKLIIEKFPEGGDDLAKVCKKLGGVPLEMADMAFRFTITPRIPVALLFWRGDEDFAAEARVLFDRAILSSCAIDTIYALAVDICDRVQKS